MMAINSTFWTPTYTVTVSSFNILGTQAILSSMHRRGEEGGQLVLEKIVNFTLNIVII